MQKMQLSPEWRQWASCIFEELQHPINLLQMKASSRAFKTCTDTSHTMATALLQRWCWKEDPNDVSCKQKQRQKQWLRFCLIAVILSIQRQNLLKKTVNATTQKTREEAWSLMAAVIPQDAHSTNTLVPVRFEFGPWPLPHWVQPQVPRATHLLLTQSFQGAASPSPLPVQHAGLRRTYTSCQAGGTHTGAGMNSAATWAWLP